MKTLLIFFFGCVFFVQAPSLQHLRNVYPSLQENATLAEETHQSLIDLSKKDGVKKWAYKGAVNTVMAKHVRNKKKKKEFYTEGVTQIEAAVKKAPNDIEIRCLRLSVQENSPRFLGYHGAIEEDKAFLIAHFSETSSESIKSFIRKYVIQSEAFSEEEKAQFQ